MKPLPTNNIAEWYTLENIAVQKQVPRYSAQELGTEQTQERSCLGRSTRPDSSEFKVDFDRHTHM